MRVTLVVENRSLSIVRLKADASIAKLRGGIDSCALVWGPCCVRTSSTEEGYLSDIR